MSSDDLAGTLPEFSTATDYLKYLGQISRLPEGFRAATTAISFTPAERPTLEPYRMNLSLVLADEPIESFAGVFTSNAFPGAPVILAREHMRQASLQGLLINNKIANVRAVNGIEDAQHLSAAAADLAGTAPESILSVSTGIIGWKLPVPEMLESLPGLCTSLSPDTAIDVAKAIMTTDSFPKMRRVALGSGSLLGIAKGAGMIEPNLATMLVFLLTDVDVPREALDAALRTAVNDSFNVITVDSDMSTSDMVLLLSSGRKPAVSAESFETALAQVCTGLAVDVVRNGEGTGHVIRARVVGLDDESAARGAAKAIVNSPLVKTAIYGNDPNVGRILSSFGDYAGTRGLDIDPESVGIWLGEEQVFKDGAFLIDRDKEIRLTEYLKFCSMNPRLVGYPQHQRVVELKVSCGEGPAVGQAIGADLSDQYVRENADYRT